MIKFIIKKIRKLKEKQEFFHFIYGKSRLIRFNEYGGYTAESQLRGQYIYVGNYFDLDSYVALYPDEN